MAALAGAGEQLELILKGRGGTNNNVSLTQSLTQSGLHQNILFTAFILLFTKRGKFQF